MEWGQTVSLLAGVVVAGLTVVVFGWRVARDVRREIEKASRQSRAAHQQIGKRITQVQERLGTEIAELREGLGELRGEVRVGMGGMKDALQTLREDFRSHVFKGDG